MEHLLIVADSSRARYGKIHTRPAVVFTMLRSKKDLTRVVEIATQLY